MNRAVIRPQAMNAPMFGITIPAILPPSRWMFARNPLPVGSGVYVVAISGLLSIGGGDCSQGSGEQGSGEEGTGEVGARMDADDVAPDVGRAGHPARGHPHRR